MSQIHWAKAVSGDFSTLVDWTGAVVPRGWDDAIVDASGSPYVVSLDTGEAVNSLQTGADATVARSSHFSGAFRGTGSGANAGSISISSTRFIVGDKLDNIGTIKINYATLLIRNPTVLSGGGSVVLSDEDNLIAPNAYSSKLTNIDNVISGGVQ